MQSTATHQSSPHRLQMGFDERCALAGFTGVLLALLVLIIPFVPTSIGEVSSGYAWQKEHTRTSEHYKNSHAHWQGFHPELEHEQWFAEGGNLAPRTQVRTADI